MTILLIVFSSFAAKFARDSEIDLQEAYGSVIDKSTAMMRNIRTKVNMRRTHHCEDKECGGGAPKARCLTDLHIAFCLAPVVDEDPGSPTFGEVVIHGERFAVISPEGCVEHQYTDEYNLDLKDARNARAHSEVRWKRIFDAFKAKHDAEVKGRAEEEALEQKQQGMTKHQRRTMLARRENDEYKQQQQREAARKARSDRQREQDDDDFHDALQHQARVPSFGMVSNSMPEVTSTADSKIEEPDELELRIGAVSNVEPFSELTPMWLHNQLFPQHQDQKSGSEDTEDWASMTLTQRQCSEIPVLSASWLQDQLFPGTYGSPAESHPSQIAGSSVENAESIQPSFTSPSLRRKETKQLKKQRATHNRALARTMAEDVEAQEEAERATKKASIKKILGRMGGARFA